jgi:hypothetical protein
LSLYIQIRRRRRRRRRRKETLIYTIYPSAYYTTLRYSL